MAEWTGIIVPILWRVGKQAEFRECGIAKGELCTEKEMFQKAGLATGGHTVSEAPQRRN
jgi:hypothetical protein